MLVFRRPPNVDGYVIGADRRRHGGYHGRIASRSTLRRRFRSKHNIQEFFQEQRVPFTGLAVIPGAKPGQNVSIRPQLLRVDKLVTGGRQVRLRAILSAFVKVTETCEVNVAEDVTGPLVLAKRVVAAGNRQVLVESITDLTVPAQKVHEIQARVCEISCEVIPKRFLL